MRRGGKDPAILRALVLKFCIDNGIQSRVVCEGVMDKMLVSENIEIFLVWIPYCKWKDWAVNKKEKAVR